MRFFAVILSLFACSQVSSADFTARPDGHAPIGVMADHTHAQGEVMLSFRSMLMKMKGLRSGTTAISSGNLFATTMFMTAPEDMTMWMHMLGAMIGISDRVTLATMLPYMANDMTVARKAQRDTISMSSSGIGDIPITAMVKLLEDGAQRVQANLGVSLPTGSITETNSGTRMGYPMQIGSGSYALLPSAVYSHFWRSWSMGAKGGARLPLDQNKYGYRLGNKYFANLWSAYVWNENVSSSLRVEYASTGAVHGSDTSLNVMMSPVNRADLQKGKHAMAYLGVNFLGTKFLSGHRFALEAGVPVYENLMGPQMARSWEGTLGWQKVF